MNDESRAAGGCERFDERLEIGFAILVINADATLDGDGYCNRTPHRRDTLSYERWLSHQAGAETARLHAIGWTAH